MQTSMHLRKRKPIRLPLSKPSLATLSLFYAVGRWNAYADNKYYITSEALKMIQYKLYQLVASATEAQTATLSEAIATAPSSTPLLVYNDGNTDATFLLIPADAEPNLALTVAPEFVGTLTATTIAASTETLNNYALNGKQFVLVMNAIDIAANKCSLSISNSNARTINLVFSDETTGLSEKGIVNSEKFATATWYDLNGRKVAAPNKKGVYIMNGRKVVVK